jgi:hypothetical protein
VLRLSVVYLKNTPGDSKFGLRGKSFSTYRLLLLSFAPISSDAENMLMRLDSAGLGLPDDLLISCLRVLKSGGLLDAPWLSRRPTVSE